MRYETIRDIDFDGHDLRVWCFRCGRGGVCDGWMWETFLERGWPIELELAAEKFRCRGCQKADRVRLFPATRIKEPPVNWTQAIAGYFHNHRARVKKARKRRRDDWAIE